MEHPPRRLEGDLQKNFTMKTMKVERDGRVIGSLEVVEFTQPLKVAYLDIITVASAYRGQHVGTALVQSFMEHVEATHSVGLLLNVLPTDHPARGMYASLGWHEVPQRPDWMYYNADLTRDEAQSQLQGMVDLIKRDYA